MATRIRLNGNSGPVFVPFPGFIRVDDRKIPIEAADRSRCWWTWFDGVEYAVEWPSDALPRVRANGELLLQHVRPWYSGIRCRWTGVCELEQVWKGGTFEVRRQGRLVLVALVGSSNKLLLVSSRRPEEWPMLIGVALGSMFDD